MTFDSNLAAPGSWTQVVVNELGVLNKEGLVGQKPLIVSVDLHHIEEIEGATIIKGDIMDPKILKQLALMASSNADDVGVNNVPLFDAVISDMAHPFTGSKSVDVPRVHQLVELALEVAKQKGILRKGGNFVAKYLNGQGDQELKNHVASHFEKIYTFKPKACRDSSTEAYFVALGFKRS